MPASEVNFVAIGWMGDYVVYFGVGLTREQAVEKWKTEYPDCTFDPADVKEFQASEKFLAYDVNPA